MIDKSEPVYVQPCSNGFDFLESNMKCLYGEERGSFENSIKRYIDNTLRECPVRAPKRLDEIPEATHAQLFELVEMEGHFRALAEDVLSEYKRRSENGEPDDDFCLAAAGVMGLCPVPLGREQTLFPNVANLYVSSVEEGLALDSRIDAHRNIVNNIVFIMQNYLEDGLTVNWNGRHLRSQGYARNAFRGENAYYATSRASAFRHLDPRGRGDPRLAILKSTIETVELALWMDKIEFVRDWPFGDVYHGAIAQHYGIPTNGIDFTSDVKTALFFACCKFEEGGWRPLASEDFSRRESRKWIADIGGDSRYGIIHFCPMDVAMMGMYVSDPTIRVARLNPVGYQPFMRCAKQSAYLVETGHPYDLFQDPSFGEIKFRLDEKLCQRVYREMEEGRLVYPIESFGPFEDAVETIKRCKVFSRLAFEESLRARGLEEQGDELEALLREQGISVTGATGPLDQELADEVNRDFWKAYRSSPFAEMEAKVRPMLCI